MTLSLAQRHGVGAAGAAGVSADTAAPARIAPRDAVVALTVFALQAVLALGLPEGDHSHRPGAAGWLLLAASAAALVWRRRAPLGCLLGMVAAVAPYHYLENLQQAAIPSSVVALYALALAGPPLRTFVVVPLVVALMIAVMSVIDTHAGVELVQNAGWVVALAVVGEMVRIHRNYVAAVTERAERAERTREEEAARRVAEERLRIARDLHDLLAHSITLIGVQTSVAAHILVEDPDRLDRAAVADALDAIAETCREARAELRTTLRVLRADADGPLPGLAGIPALVRAAEAAGARVVLAADTGPRAGAPPVPPAVGAAAYRIVQESLTNAVRHAGAAGGPRIAVRLDRTDTALRLDVRDDGPEDGTGYGHRAATSVPGPRGEGFGIVGMRERARSVGGTLTAGPRAGAPGFRVTAELPLAVFAAPAASPPSTKSGAPAASQPSTDFTADPQGDSR